MSLFSECSGIGMLGFGWCVAGWGWVVFGKVLV